MRRRNLIRHYSPGDSYDSEVSYLQGNKSQYIDTNIIPNSQTGSKVSFSVIGYNDSYMVGCRNDSNDTRWLIGTSLMYVTDSGIYYGYNGFAGTRELGTTIASEIFNNRSSIHTAELNYFNSKQFIVDDKYSISLPTLSFTPSYNIRLFGGAGVSAEYTKWAGRIYSVQITQGSNVIMNLMPVVKNSIGYMYDKVSRTLLTNSGGQFSYG